MNILLWLLVIGCFLLSFVALVRPIIPGLPILWAGFLLYHFGINHEELTISFWIIMIIFTIFTFAIDFIANKYFLQKYGGTKWGERIGALSIIVGSFVVPPFGLLLVPFIAVFLVEKAQGKDLLGAIQVAWATVLSFLSSTFVKALLQVMSIVIFLLYVIF